MKVINEEDGEKEWSDRSEENKVHRSEPAIETELDLLEEEEEALEDIPKESRISKIFSERITRTVIILIMVMLFLQPLFSLDTFISQDTSFEIGLTTLLSVYKAHGSAGLGFDSSYDK